MKFITQRVKPQLTYRGYDDETRPKAKT